MEKCKNFSGGPTGGRDGAGRVCFGSDTPFALMHVCVAEYNALLDGEVTPEEKAQIMGGNLLRLLAIHP